METITTPLTLATPATHVDVQPGQEIVLHGSLRSTLDGSIIDAASTTGGTPGADPGGLVDLEAGGFHVTSRDLAKHEVRAVATEGSSPTCAALGVASPCLPLRLVPLAHSRLVTVDELRASLKGTLSADLPYAPIVGVTPEVQVRSAAPYVAALVGITMLLAILFGVMSWSKARARSPIGRLVALADRVKYKADRADPALAAPLMPAVRAAMIALRGRKIDASSPQGLRVALTLEQLELRLDSNALAARDSREREIADALIQEMDAAVHAAEEAHRAASAYRA
jgi:hypothetical protein